MKVQCCGVGVEHGYADWVRGEANLFFEHRWRHELFAERSEVKQRTVDNYGVAISVVALIAARHGTMENKVVFCCFHLAALANHNDLVFIFPHEGGDSI